jgi:hypothetical protein
MLLSEIDKFYGLENGIPLKKRLFEYRTEKVKKLMVEAYGSFPEQYDSVKKISDEIVLKIEKKEFIKKDGYFLISITENVIGIGEVNISVRWYDNKYGDKVVYGKRVGKNNIELSIYAGEVVYYNLSSTIAHEIMHCFQDTLPKVKGVNEKSIFLYSHVLEFYQNAPSSLVANFFYGLYICYSFEASANISSVANYISSFFNGKKNMTTIEMQKALYKFDKYQDYDEIYKSLVNKSYIDFSEDDIRYIERCMTNKLHNYVTDNMECIYDRNKFNVEKFINSNIKNIVNICRTTIDKMWKNTMLYINEK